MISKELTNRIKCTLGFRYSSQILDYLRDSGITNTEGKPYSRSYIIQIVNGVRHDLRIEEAIVDLCKHKASHVKNVLQKKEKFLNEGLKS